MVYIVRSRQPLQSCPHRISPSRNRRTGPPRLDLGHVQTLGCDPIGVKLRSSTDQTVTHASITAQASGEAMPKRWRSAALSSVVLRGVEPAGMPAEVEAAGTAETKPVLTPTRFAR
jgi:hypothetical protein